jgi:multidrug efflux pump subunit AcrA (membrane-fusion protein)
LYREPSAEAAVASQNRRIGAEDYAAWVEAEPESLRGLGGRKLVPGMPVESFIQTSSRKAISYFVKPFTDQLNRVFREE